MDPAKLQAHLTCECALVVLETTTSTNDEIKQRLAQPGGGICAQALALEQGATPCFANPSAMGERPSPQSYCQPLVVVSAQQTAGRGRLGRTWVSPQGGVYLSLLLEACADLENTSALPLVVALGVREALESLAPHTTVRIKWPNDVICPQGKLAGVLVERAPFGHSTQDDTQHSTQHSAQDDAASSDTSDPASPLPAFIVGVGINVSRPECDAFENAAYLDEHATQSPTREQAAAAVINAVLARHQQWQAAAFSFEPFVADYAQQLSILGENIVVRAGGGQPIAEGKVSGIDSHGRLQLLKAGQTVSVSAGEVTLRSP
ncbi:MAG: biotin--[acetyl-CoA-carboxylase] ligase [Coriobacteriales bacterium]|nr:biotin--[acetyl-CoA-carboxylase] ligase [Coriobacteriales bacterium]